MSCKSRIYAPKAAAISVSDSVWGVQGIVELQRNADGQIFHKNTNDIGLGMTCFGEVNHDGYGEEFVSIWGDGTYIYTSRYVKSWYNYSLICSEVRINMWSVQADGDLKWLAQGCTHKFVNRSAKHGIYSRNNLIYFAGGYKGESRGEITYGKQRAEAGWFHYGGTGGAFQGVGGGNATGNLYSGPGFQIFNKVFDDIVGKGGLYHVATASDINSTEVYVDSSGYIFTADAIGCGLAVHVLTSPWLSNAGSYAHSTIDLVASDKRDCSCISVNDCDCELVTGGICGDGTYIYVVGSNSGIGIWGDSSLHQNLSAYTWNGTTLTHVAEIEDFSDHDIVHSIWEDGNFIYVGGDKKLFCFEFDGTSFTLKSSIFTCSICYSVSGDGDFVYVNHGELGLHSFKVDTNGILTHVSHNLSTIPDEHSVGYYYGVWAGQVNALDNASAPCLTTSSNTSSSQSSLSCQAQTAAAINYTCVPASACPTCLTPSASWFPNTYYACGTHVYLPIINKTLCPCSGYPSASYTPSISALMVPGKYCYAQDFEVIQFYSKPNNELVCATEDTTCSSANACGAEYRAMTPGTKTISVKVPRAFENHEVYGKWLVLDSEDGCEHEYYRIISAAYTKIPSVMYTAVDCSSGADLLLGWDNLLNLSYAPTSGEVWAYKVNNCDSRCAVLTGASQQGFPNNQLLYGGPSHFSNCNNCTFEVGGTP